MLKNLLRKQPTAGIQISKSEGKSLPIPIPFKSKGVIEAVVTGSTLTEQKTVENQARGSKGISISAAQVKRRSEWNPRDGLWAVAAK